MSTTAPAKARIQVRRTTYRGRAGWLICGKDSHGMRVRIFREHRLEALLIARALREGRTQLKGETAPSPEERIRELELTIERMMAELPRIANRLRDTAAGLRQYQRTGHVSTDHCVADPVKCVHPSHAANRLDKLAEQISKKEQSK